MTTRGSGDIMPSAGRWTREAGRSRRRTGGLTVVAAFLLLTAPPLVAQDFDYHLEETPAVSWNAVGFHDARLLALGGVSLDASDAFAASVNPALIPRDRLASLALSGSRLRFEAMQYWGLNQGLISSPSPPSDMARLASGFAGHVRVKGVGLAGGWYVNSLPRFPDLELRQDSANGQYTSYGWEFDGTEDVAFVAAAAPAWKGLRLGLRLDYIKGRREATVWMAGHYFFWVRGATAMRSPELREQQRHDTKMVVPSVGLAWAVTPAWTVAGQLAWPLDGTARRSLTRTFENAADNVFLSDRQTSSDRAYRPQRATLGTAIDLGVARSTNLRLAGEAAYVRWSAYRLELFGEEQPRDLNDALAVGAGAELTTTVVVDISLRLGYRRDPQPVKVPATALDAVSGGLGVRWRGLAIDAGAAQYRGSAGGVAQRHTVLAFTLSYVAR